MGDRVLSQHPETGELAFKTVLLNEVRPPVQLVAVFAGEEEIACTASQPFWVSGEGWIKARDLKPGMRLHGVTGVTPVEKVENRGKETTYNLVVADFHTFYTGFGKALCHDNTFRRPVNEIVPGLIGR